jgi:hypothetical protein
MVMLSAIVLVSVLGWWALRPIENPVPFSRLFLADSIRVLNSLEKPEDIVDFAGNTINQIYFRSKTPDKIYITDSHLQNGKYVNTDIPTNGRINSLFGVIVDSPNINVYAGNLPGVIRVSPNQTAKVTKFSDELFTRVVLINSNSFVMRMYDGLDQVFAKGNFLTGQLVKEEAISTKKQDAGLSSDGFLTYDKKINQLAYVHFYNNEILCIDTNLHLVKKIKTIDNSTTGFTAGEMKSKNQITSLTPRRLVNRYASLYNGVLFINSERKSAQENEEFFKTNSVIDLYDIVQGKYIGSFYLPYHGGERMKTFRTFDDKLLALYKNSIVSYTLPNILR